MASKYLNIGYNNKIITHKDCDEIGVVVTANELIYNNNIPYNRKLATAWTIGGISGGNGLQASPDCVIGTSSSNKLSYMFDYNNKYHIFYKNGKPNNYQNKLLNESEDYIIQKTNTRKIGDVSIGDVGGCAELAMKIVLPGRRLFTNINSGLNSELTIQSYIDTLYDSAYPNNPNSLPNYTMWNDDLDQYITIPNPYRYNIYFWVQTSPYPTITDDGCLADFYGEPGWIWLDTYDYINYLNSPGWWEYQPGTLAWGHYNLLKYDNIEFQVQGTFPGNYFSNGTKPGRYITLGLCFPVMFKYFGWSNNTDITHSNGIEALARLQRPEENGDSTFRDMIPFNVYTLDYYVPRDIGQSIVLSDLPNQYSNNNEVMYGELSNMRIGFNLGYGENFRDSRGYQATSFTYNEITITGNHSDIDSNYTPNPITYTYY